MDIVVQLNVFFTQTPERKDPSLLLDKLMCERFVKVDRFQISLWLAVFYNKVGSDNSRDS